MLEIVRVANAGVVGRRAYGGGANYKKPRISFTFSSWLGNRCSGICSFPNFLNTMYIAHALQAPSLQYFDFKAIEVEGITGILL